MRYIISQITTFDEYNELFDTKVGTDGKDMPLLFTCHGATPELSRIRAENLVTVLNSRMVDPFILDNAFFRPDTSLNLEDNHY